MKSARVVALIVLLVVVGLLIRGFASRDPAVAPDAPEGRSDEPGMMETAVITDLAPGSLSGEVRMFSTNEPAVGVLVTGVEAGATDIRLTMEPR